MWIAITAAAVILVLVVLVQTGTMVRGVKRAHFVELLGGIAKRKASATGLEIAEPAASGDAASARIVTTIGVAMLWTASRDGDIYVHHVRLSGRGRAWSFRGVMLAFLLDRLGLKSEDATSARSPDGADHLRITVSAAEQQAMWDRAIRPVPDQAFGVFLMDIRKSRDAIRRVEWAGSPFASDTVREPRDLPDEGFARS